MVSNVKNRNLLIEARSGHGGLVENVSVFSLSLSLSLSLFFFFQSCLSRLYLHRCISVP
ncbi:hypothetical protein BDV38DRAFT_214375 [Aspergillus pseudotamarii]|uniref:Uncharacterized protein n=1 Tax=Aspergillus pseudotamarii TaxID=132259 RepID=A0A5N6SF33_ASPPS|nr:uncharacterized protein BDV38DRAFT_214375 [Aspergillus pseudotamarii]KAE8132320.1 hypothetical protein BDV38DRAFT_214375 [Aspergillus pseudotamarii]